MLFCNRFCRAENVHSFTSRAACIPVVHTLTQATVVAAHKVTSTTLQTPVSQLLQDRCSCFVCGSVKDAATLQTDAAAAVQQDAADSWSPGTLEATAYETLKDLGQYQPTGLSDGPASLSQVLPYNAAAYQDALQHSMRLLHTFPVYRLSNIAAALAAAGHVDKPFMQQLGIYAAIKLQTAPALKDNAAAVAQLKAISYLAVAYARMGMLHTELLSQIAVSGAKLLLRGRLRPSKRLHAQYIAQLAAAYAALQLHPPHLYRAVGELLKQQRRVVSLLGPQESMLLLWAFSKVGHNDPPAQLMLTQRAATQVGQLNCKGLAHAYMLCAQANLTAPPLLTALRKATRQRLPAMSPQDLTALLTALAALGQQDSLLLDESAKAVHNKLMNFTAAQISSTLSALNLLSYRNHWLLEHASKILVSSKLNKAAQLTATQLADLLVAVSQLRYYNTRLFDHLGLTVVNTQTLDSWSAGELAAVLQGYSMLGFSQPVLLKAAAIRLLRLVSMHHGGIQQWQQQSVSQLIESAYHIANLFAPTRAAANDGTVTAAVLAVAAAAVQQKHCSCIDWIKLGIAMLVVACPLGVVASATTADRPAANAGDASFPHMVPGMPAMQFEQLSGPAAAQEQQASSTSTETFVQRQQADSASASAMLQRVLQQVQHEVQAEVRVQQLGPELLWLMQLLWLKEAQQSKAAVLQQQSAAGAQGADARQAPAQQGWQHTTAGKAAGKAGGKAAGKAAKQHQQQVDQLQQAPGADAGHAAELLHEQHQQSRQQHVWQLGLSQRLVDSYLQQHVQHHSQQQEQQRHGEALPLRTVMAAIQKQAHALGVEVQAPYQIPSSPIILPAALVPCREGTSALSKNRPAGTGSESSSSSTISSSNQVQLKGTQLAASNAAGNNQHQPLPTASLTARVQLQPLRVHLTSKLLSQLKSWASHDVHVAVFISCQGPGGLPSWHSSSLPEQMLPVAAEWYEGLACAGWGLLLLNPEQDM